MGNIGGRRKKVKGRKNEGKVDNEGKVEAE